MLSALIRTEHSYRALPLAGQLVDQRFVHPGPLVLGTTLLKLQRPHQIWTNLSHAYSSTVTSCMDCIFNSFELVNVQSLRVSFEFPRYCPNNPGRLILCLRTSRNSEIRISPKLVNVPIYITIYWRRVICLLPRIQTVKKPN